MLKRVALSLPLITLLSYGGVEVQYGTGTFGMEGGFLGLDHRIDCDISTFTIKDEHSNFGNFYYGFNLTWLDSDKLRQAQKSYNSLAKKGSEYLWNYTHSKSATIPEIEYRVKGLDLNLRLGYDIIHKDKNNYLGIGVLLGISAPYIDADKGNSVAPDLGFMYDNAGYLLDAYKLFSKSKTDFTTYKIGPTVSFQKELIESKLFLYGTASYAYQNADIDNSFAHMGFNADGTFASLDVGLTFKPFASKNSSKYQNLYVTAGYNYSKWEVKDVAFDISGAEVSSKILNPLKSKFSMDSQTAYVGLGLSF